MNNEQIVALATSIAAAAPRKQGQYVYNAGIPWSLIHALRMALDDAGIEWVNR